MPTGKTIHILGAVKTTGTKRIIPQIMEWNLSIQHQVAQNWAAQIGYVGTRAVHLWNHEASDLNQPPQILDSNFCGPYRCGYWGVYSTEFRPQIFQPTTEYDGGFATRLPAIANVL